MNRFRVLQQLSTYFRQTTLSEALTSFFRADIHAFDVSGVRRAGDYVQLEDQLPVLHQHPHTILVDATQVTLAKSDWIFLQWIDTTRFECHRGLSADDGFQIFGIRETKSGNVSSVEKLFAAS